jgi:hypothetical protein
MEKRQARRPGLDFYNPGQQSTCHNGGPWRTRVMKVDATGTLLWAYQYQVGVGCTVPRDLAATRDGGAVFVAGTPTSPDNGGEVPVVVRLDKFGKIVWQVAFQSSDLVWLTAIAVRSDGTILVAGAGYRADKNVISLDDGGRILSVDRLSGDFDSIEAIVAFDDGYAAALSWETYPQYEIMLDRVPAVVRVGAGNVLWSVKLPTVPSLWVYDVPVALLPAPGNGVVVQSATGRDAMLDGAGRVLWNHYVGNHVSDAPLGFGTVDDFGTFWRPFIFSLDYSADATRALHRVALNGAVSDVVLGSSEAAPLALARSTNGIIGVLAADADADLNDATSLLAYDAFAPGCLSPSAPSDSLVFTDLGTGEEAAAVGIGSGSVATIPISAVRYCLGATDTLVCGANTARAAAAGEACGGPLLTFEFTDEQKVLISKYGPEDYLSRYQTLLAGDQSIQSPDRHIEVRVRVTRDGIPAAGVNVYFRVTDPPDTAPYTIAAHDAKTDDNDPAGPKGALIVPTPCANAPSGAPPCTTSGSDGWARVILTVTDHAAGDNYLVEGSTDPAFACGSSCPRSGLITAWKRLYVEEQHMFRAGRFVNGEVRGGTSEIPVDDPTPFLNLHLHDRLELVHAAAPGSGSYFFDIVSFKTVVQKSDGSWRVVTENPVPRYYGALGDDHLTLDIQKVARDGIGIVAGGVYEPDITYVASLYASMFVDVVPISSAVEEVPYVPEVTTLTALFYSSRWLQHRVAVPTTIGHPQPNVFHRMGVTQAPYVPDPRGGPCFGVELGFTMVGTGSELSMILVQRMQDVIAGTVIDPACHNRMGAEYFAAPLVRVNGEVTAHETTHLWSHSVHLPSVDGNGHCLRERYQHDGLECLMHAAYAGGGLFDGLVALHYESVNDSEYMWVRREREPVPLQ